jgi:hypothetical protein
LQSDNVKRTIRSLFPAIAALDRIAVEFRVAVIFAMPIAGPRHHLDY